MKLIIRVYNIVRFPRDHHRQIIRIWSRSPAGGTHGDAGSAHRYPVPSPQVSKTIQSILRRKQKWSITDIKVRKLFDEGPMKAIVSVTFDGQLAVHDIKVINARDKFFIVMPSRKNPDGSYRDIVHPINAQFRGVLEEAVISAYNKELEIAKAAALAEAEAAAAVETETVTE